MHGRVDIFFNYDVLCIIKVCPLSCAVNVGVVSGAWAGPKNVLLSCDLSTLLPIFLETPLAEGEQRGWVDLYQLLVGRGWLLILDRSPQVWTSYLFLYSCLLLMPRYACASKVYDSVFVCVCVCLCMHVDSCSRSNELQVIVYNYRLLAMFLSLASAILMHPGIVTKYM